MTPSTNGQRKAAVTYPLGTQRDIDAAAEALGKAIHALLRVKRTLYGQSADRFGGTLDAACLASNSLLIFAAGGWGADAGVVRLYESDGPESQNGDTCP